MAVSGLDGLGPSTNDRTADYLRRAPEPPHGTPITPAVDRESAIDRRPVAAGAASESDADREKRRTSDAAERDDQSSAHSADLALDVARSEASLSRLQEATAEQSVRRSLLGD